MIQKASGVGLLPSVELSGRRRRDARPLVLRLSEGLGRTAPTLRIRQLTVAILIQLTFLRECQLDRRPGCIDANSLAFHESSVVCDPDYFWECEVS
jgi:hypothetical protein